MARLRHFNQEFTWAEVEDERAWLYPLPAVAAIAGFVFVLVSRQNFQKELRYAVVLLVAGLLIFFLRAWGRREWPFQPAAALEKTWGE